MIEVNRPQESEALLAPAAGFPAQGRLGSGGLDAPGDNASPLI